MEQYIDKAAVVAEIERRRDLHYKYYMKNGAGSIAECKYDEDKDILSFLDTLEMKEVDLEKSLTGFMGRYAYENGGEYPSAIDIAKYFFELGIKSKSSYVGIPNIDDTLKEMGVDPDSKSAKSFKEFYYMALEKFKAQKGEKV